jgi:hypothetical protein
VCIANLTFFEQIIMNSVIHNVLFLGVVLSAIAPFSAPASAQLASTELSACSATAIQSGAGKIVALSRARHLARQAAETANGGLEFYQAEAAMHGRVSDAPCVDNGNGSWTFNVKGGQPGFTTPTQETIVTVDGNTWNITVDYNGAVQS